MDKTKVLVVEDEPGISDAMEYNLIKEGFTVRVTPDGENALQLLKSDLPNLVLLDLMLPGIDGLELCRQMKNNKTMRNIPIIMVSAKGEESDIVLGLGLGADDYVSKPFSIKELIGRIKAVLRRGQVENDDKDHEHIVYKDLEIDSVKYEVRACGELVNLTATEFRMLHHMASNPGRAFTRDRLLSASVDENTFVLDRNVDVHIRAIRKKLGECSQYIITIHGIGYRFCDD